MQSTMQDMQIKFTAVPHGTHQEYGGRQYYGGCGYHGKQSSYRGQGGHGAQKMEIGVEAVVIDPTVILHITDGHTECVPIRVNNSGPQKITTKRTQYGVTRCWAVRETAPDRSGRYLLIKLM